MAKKNRQLQIELVDQQESFIDETELLEMNPTIVTRKDNLELIKLHQELLRNYMANEKHMNYLQIRKVMALYDSTINHENIRYYYHRHVRIFLVALITDRLDSIKNYNPKGYYEYRKAEL